MTLKLKDGCWYECDPRDWREIAVCGFAGVVEDGEGPVIVRANVEPGSEMDLFAIDEEGHEICDMPDPRHSDALTPLSATVRHGHSLDMSEQAPWDEVAHAALIERGWFTPWEVV